MADNNHFLSRAGLPRLWIYLGTTGRTLIQINLKAAMIPKRFETIVFAFFMSLMMSFLMSGVVTFINLGIVDHFVILWFKAFIRAFAIAFPCVLLLVPLVRKIVGKLVK